MRNFGTILILLTGVVFSFAISEEILLLASGAKNAEERRISIRLESVIQMANNHVGFDWKLFLVVRDQVIREGESLELELKNRQPLKVEAHAVEVDEEYSDAGENHMTFSYSDLIAAENSRFEMDVEVIENGGQYAGNIARWKFIFEITQL